MKRIVAIITGILGFLLIISGLGWITLTLQFQLYLGISLLLVALFLFLIG